MRCADLPAVAVIADAHYHDLEGDYGFEGVEISGKRLTARSWADTRASTRVFNESYRALPAALDEIAARGIRHVVLLGDYTDDGQRQTTEAVRDLLKTYEQELGLSFYAIPGNHDVFGPNGRHQSKDFLTGTGSSVILTSDPAVAAANPTRSRLSDRMYCDGYPAGLMPMAAFGLFARPEYLYWESPFGGSDDILARQYTVSSADGRSTFRLMDASYLVEPEDGLWLLMIDANVFEPRNGQYDPFSEQTFIDSTGAGWNAVLRLKPFLIDWIADVHARAKMLGKTVMCFSHYPVIDPFDDVAGSEAMLFGNTNVVKRTPLPAVAQALTSAGMTSHFSGHLHVDGITKREVAGRSLTNIAVPSLVAFPPAFKIVYPLKAIPEMETVMLHSMALDRRLCQLYRQEAVLLDENPDQAFDAADYGTFLYQHMRSLVTSRYLPQEWPSEVVAQLSASRVSDICIMFIAHQVRRTGSNPAQPEPRSLTMLEEKAAEFGMSVGDLECVEMIDLITDWYCLRRGNSLALPFIPERRIAAYNFLTSGAIVYGQSHPSESVASFVSTFLKVLGESLHRSGVPTRTREPAAIL
jgi:3',5'-cyclic AMP phosphodiesterase CpdA